MFRRRAVVLAAIWFLSAVGLVSAQEAPLPQAPVLAPPSGAQPAIAWEVKSRFRLFRHESDFLRHVAADHGDGVLAAERRMAAATAGRGWARLMLNSLCIDAAGQVLATCERDGVNESYLAPADHRIGVRARNVAADATCGWTFEQVDQAVQSVVVPCGEEVFLRARYGTPMLASVVITRADGTGARATAEILVRDLLIAGLGDSVAAGEGNPDRPIALDDAGFCFRRVLGAAGNEYYRPGRAGYRGNRACGAATREQSASADWLRRGAGWMSGACHRSLYSYQARTALALAIENPHVAVTFVPLACTGAEIESGLFESRRARETTCRGRTCPATVPAQLGQAAAVLEGARRRHPGRNFDLILLTVGANDIYFSELVGNVLLDESPERSLLATSGAIASVEDAQGVLQQQLPTAFAKLRAALKPLVGGDLEKVVYVSYANPALHAGGQACPGGAAGVDVHPAFRVNAELLQSAVRFVDEQFLPRLRALARCENGVLCKDAAERMTFVDAHQPAFREHGFCARAEDDPSFDRACFSPQGESFRSSLREGAQRPLACNISVREFRPYASRARWIRTPNDSYFAAMTYPDGLPATMQPADIHDALWGVLSAVYGGAIHPTAEGHAAMADAALVAVRRVLTDSGALPALPELPPD